MKSIEVGQLLAGPRFHEPMRVETVKANGPETWVLGLVGVQTERFRSVTLSTRDLDSLRISGSALGYDGDAKLIRLGLQAYALGIAYEFPFNWNHVSVIAGLPRAKFLFRLHEGSVKKEEVVEFLKALRVHLKRPLLILWDSAKPHRSNLVRDYPDSTEGDIQVALLPPYAPDLNPVEYLWAWLKRLALANFCPDGLDELHATARNKLESAQHQPSIIAACWTQASLW